MRIIIISGCAICPYEEMTHNGTRCKNDVKNRNTPEDGISSWCRLQEIDIIERKRVEDEIRRRIAATNTLPEQQRALKGILKWIELKSEE